MHLLAAFLLLAQTTAAGQAAESQGRGGTVTGRVSVAGLAPKLPNMPITRDMKICGTSKPDTSLELGAGGSVRYALVWIPDVPAKAGSTAGAAPVSGPVVKIDQVNCQFEPHLIAAPVGATLKIVNSDPLYHQVRGSEAGSFNFPMPVKGYSVTFPLETPGALKLGSDAHPWMRAFVHVMKTPAFAVTDAEGKFRIEGVPPGTYKLKVWHERLGEHEDTVVVESGETAGKDFSLPPR